MRTLTRPLRLAAQLKNWCAYHWAEYRSLSREMKHYRNSKR